ncbi:hypothetical protein PMAYCL1PPCAC_11261, partial [Pristionchus mayeri]
LQVVWCIKDSEDNRERRSEENRMTKKQRKEEKKRTKDEGKRQRESTRNGENQTGRMEMRDSEHKVNENPLPYQEQGGRNGETAPTRDPVEENSDVEGTSRHKPMNYKKVLLERSTKEKEKGKKKKEEEEKEEEEKRKKEEEEEIKKEEEEEKSD